MGSLVSADKSTSRKKGIMAAGAATGSALLIAFGPAVLGVAGLVGAGYLTYDWFMFRAKRGMRF